MRLKRTGIATKIILGILAVYAVTAILSLRSRISEAREANSLLTAQAADIAAENDQLSYALENQDDDEVIRDIAREELGLGERGEMVYYAGQEAK